MAFLCIFFGVSDCACALSCSSDTFPTIGDAHIYLDHEDGLKEQITRTPFTFPLLKITDRNQCNVEDFSIDDFVISNYQCHEKIKLHMAV